MTVTTASKNALETITPLRSTDTTNVHVIGLTGLARAGKDTVSTILAKHAGFTRAAFADALREAALALDPWVLVSDPIPADPESYRLSRLNDVITEMGWERAKNDIPEVRRILQRLGTEAGWKIHGEDLWIKPVLAVIAANPQTSIAVTDVRFPAEIKAIQALPNGHIFHVSRDKTRRMAGDIPTDQAHLSERVALSLERGDTVELETEGVDTDSIIVIDNNGSLDELTETVLTALSEL